ncbi:MAG: hypothetical protein ABI461_22750, partial [Polyangiaceae bacterium]
AFRKMMIASDPSETVNNQPAYKEAFAAVNYPAELVPPRADMLTPAQRAFAEVITTLDLGIRTANIDVQMPRSRAFRRRWLGLDPASVIDKDVTFTLGGEKRKEPAWRAVLLLNDANESRDALLATFSVGDRLAMWGAVKIAWPEDFGLKGNWFFDDRYEVVSKMGTEGGEWAKVYADAYLAAGKRSGPDSWLIFMALVRAQIPIEPRWDALLPLGFGVYDELVRECVAAIPEERRAAAILAALPRQHPATSVKAAVNLLPIVPDPAIAQWAVENIKNMVEPKKLVLGWLKEAASKSPAVLVVIAAFEKGGPPPIQLTARDARSPRSGFSDIDKQQLLAAGKAYHGRAVSIDKLLADDPHNEESLLSLLEACVLADDKGRALYDVWQYAGDSGEIFKTGTTKSVGGINQGSVECDDEALTDAIGAALHSTPRPGKKAAKAKPKATAEAKPKAKPKSPAKR